MSVSGFDKFLRRNAEIEIGEQRGVGSGQRELDRLRIDRFDRRDGRIERALRRVHRWIDQSRVGEDDVVGGQGRAIGEIEPRAQLENPGPGIGRRPALGEIGLRLQRRREMHQSGIDEIGRAIGRGVAREPGVERSGVDIGADHHRLCGLGANGRHERRGEHEGRDESKMRFFHRHGPLFLRDETGGVYAASLAPTANATLSPLASFDRLVTHPTNVESIAIRANQPSSDPL